MATSSHMVDAKDILLDQIAKRKGTLLPVFDGLD